MLFTASTVLEIAAWGHGEAFMPLFLEQALGVPEAEVPRWTGLMAAAPLAVATPIAPLWGVLADRYSRKIIILRSLLLASVAYGLIAFAQDVWQLLAVRLLLGLSFGSNAVIIATMADLVPGRRLGLAIGFSQMALPIGRSIGPLLGSGLIGLVSLRGMFAADALMVLAAFLLVWLLFEEPPRRRDVRLGVVKRLMEVAGVVAAAVPLRLTYLLALLFGVGMALVTPFLPLLIDQVYQGQDLALVIGLVLAGYGALAALAAPLAGRVAEGVGTTRLLTLSMAGLTLMSLGLVFATSPLQVGVIVLLLGAIPFGASGTAFYAHLVRVSPREHLSTILSLVQLARTVAMLIGPLVGAAVSGIGLRAVFATAVAAYLLASGVSLGLARASEAPNRP